MLNKLQLEQFSRDGYTVYPNYLSGATVQSLLEEVEKITDGNTLENHDADRMEMEPDQLNTGTAVRRLYEPCSYYEIFKDLSEDSRLLDCVEQLFGPNLLFHYSKLNMKPPSIGSIVEWHQDLSYYPLTNTDSMAVLFYLDDTSEENGALQLLPGCHRSRLLNHAGDQNFFQGKLTEQLDCDSAEIATGSAGTAIFMHGMTPHASAPNISNKPRRTLILSYRAADAFPLYCGSMTVKGEKFVRQVRGKPVSIARFDRDNFPVPVYREDTASLYELQAQSRGRGSTSN